MVDEHCHIIWDVDDGASTREEALAMLDAAAKAGITQMVCTPHMRWNDFDAVKVQSHFSQLQRDAAARGIRAELGYEVYYNRLMKIGLDKAPLYARSNGGILIEFNTSYPMEQGWERTVYDLQSLYGLRVTMAHPERYTTVLEDYEQVYRIKDAGCRVQVSAFDLYGGMFNKVAKCAKWILKEGLCDALVSDAHCAGHYVEFAKAIDKYY